MKAPSERTLNHFLSSVFLTSLTTVTYSGVAHYLSCPITPSVRPKRKYVTCFILTTPTPTVTVGMRWCHECIHCAADQFPHSAFYTVALWTHSYFWPPCAWLSRLLSTFLLKRTHHWQRQWTHFVGLFFSFVYNWHKKHKALDQWIWSVYPCRGKSTSTCLPAYMLTATTGIKCKISANCTAQAEASKPRQPRSSFLWHFSKNKWSTEGRRAVAEDEARDGFRSSYYSILSSWLHGFVSVYAQAYALICSLRVILSYHDDKWTLWKRKPPQLNVFPE